MMYIYSPEFHKHYPIPEGDRVSDKRCPLDSTLIIVKTTQQYYCPACNGNYTTEQGKPSADEVESIARHYARSLRNRLQTEVFEKEDKEKLFLERIVRAAKCNGLL